jgi:hypothetical protein
MRQLHKLKYIALSCLALGITSCEKDFLDVNRDPNRSLTGDANLLFAAAAADFSHNRASELNIPIAIISQNWSSGGNFGWGTAEDQYDISVFTTGNTWRTAYTGVLKNVKYATDDAIRRNQINAVAQCNILRASAYAQTTLLWERIPFAQAINLSVDQPAFDDQPAVLNGVIALLDSSVSIIDPAAPAATKIVKEDYYYGGDMNKWIRYANSLKLRTLMTMVDADPSKAAEIGALIAGGNMIASQADNALFKYYAQSGTQNPRFRILDQYAGGQNIFFFANNVIYNQLATRKDPRLDIFFDEGPEAKAGVYEAVGAGEEASETTAVVSLDILQATSPDVLFTYAEQLLLEAEAHARGFAPGGLVAANTKYRMGVEESMRYFGVAEADITAFLATLPDLATLSAAQARDEISQQLWVEYYSRPIEGWTQWRRSGPEGAEVPRLTPSSLAPAGGMIRRLPYPPLEIAANPNTPTQPPLDAKMWFDK